MPKCRYCGEPLKGPSEGGKDGVDYVKRVKNYYYHPICMEKWTKASGGAINDNVQGMGDFWKDLSYNYLLYEVRMEVNLFLFLNQWEKFLKEGKKPKGLYLTLRYFYDVRKGDKEKAHGGIGIISYLYEEAGQYWVEQQEKNEEIVLELERQIALQMEKWNVNPRLIKKEKKTRKKKYDLDGVKNE